MATKIAPYLYGNIGRVPVPDIERTEFFLIFDGNPRSRGPVERRL